MICFFGFICENIIAYVNDYVKYYFIMKRPHQMNLRRDKHLSVAGLKEVIGKEAYCTGKIAEDALCRALGQFAKPCIAFPVLSDQMAAFSLMQFRNCLRAEG